MTESNSAWGVQYNDEFQEAWDSYGVLPDAGVHSLLDAFCESKHITIGDLVRVGARLSDRFTLVYGGPGYLKFRDLRTGRKWGYVGSTFDELMIISQHPSEQADVIILAEGESDAARLSGGYECDIAIMPGGAMTFKPSWATRLREYRLVLVATDADRRGDEGAEKILKLLTNGQRFRPEQSDESDGNDWCAMGVLPPLPSVEDFELEHKRVFTWAEVQSLDDPPIISWFERALLPVGGQMIIHGWAKSFKSFVSLDILAALAQGEPWCHFEPTEEPCRVAVLQYEITLPYYKQRMQTIESHAVDIEKLHSNFLTIQPNIRPTFRAGNKSEEDAILHDLEEYDVQVFLLDPIRRAIGLADLNSEKEVRPLLDFMGRVQDLGVTVVLTHHDNKTYSRSGGGDPLGMTGAGAFAGDADTIVSVSIPHGLEVKDPIRNLGFTLRNAQSPGTRSMRMEDSGSLFYSTSPVDSSEASAEELDTDADSPPC